MKNFKRKPSGDCSFSRPFESLQDLFEHEYAQLPSCPSDIPPGEVPVRADSGKSDRELFEEAMTGVRPVSREKRGRMPLKSEPVPSAERDAEALIRLRNLVENGEGFIVSNTPEYMEGRGYNVSPEVVRRLHRGDFSIQDHIDLHGLNVRDARDVVNRFLKESLRNGRRAVLIVHGRGLSSPVRPVLKTKVCQWLTSGYWRKWVMAFASARPFDGGAGATYVLLRHRPVTKRLRKKSARRANAPDQGRISS